MTDSNQHPAKPYQREFGQDYLKGLDTALITMLEQLPDLSWHNEAGPRFDLGREEDLLFHLWVINHMDKGSDVTEVPLFSVGIFVVAEGGEDSEGEWIAHWVTGDPNALLELLSMPESDRYRLLLECAQRMD